MMGTVEKTLEAELPLPWRLKGELIGGQHAGLVHLPGNRCFVELNFARIGFGGTASLEESQ
jgi:hypothetical protein